MNSLTNNEDIIYLVNKLLNSVVVIPPILCLTTEEREEKGQLN
jgi:hypothetical protein